MERKDHRLGGRLQHPPQQFGLDSRPASFEASLREAPQDDGLCYCS
jgi:hypothetical protein